MLKSNSSRRYEGATIQMSESYEKGQAREATAKEMETVEFIADTTPRREDADGVCYVNGFRCDFFGNPEKSQKMYIVESGGFPRYIEFRNVGKVGFKPTK